MTGKFAQNSRVRRPITMRDVARHLHCDPSTVSRALRHEPTISQSRGEWIRQEAKRLGYRPDPVVSAFTAQVRGYRRRKGLGTIATVSRKRAKPDSCLFRGLQQEAEAHGYQVDSLAMDEMELKPRVLNRVLRARGIRMLIVLPVDWNTDYSGIDFASLAAARIGPSLKQPRLPMISANHFRNVHLACARLREQGHFRIGLSLSELTDQRLDGQWLGGYLAYCQMAGPRKTPPVFRPEQQNPEQFHQWICKQRLTAVLTPGHYYLRDWLHQAGRDHETWPVTLASLTGDQESSWPGIDERMEEVGAAAVRTVIARIQRNSTGVPDNSETILIEGRWRSGESTRPGG